MRFKSAFPLVIICLFTLISFVNISNAITQDEYEIEINVKCSCPIPFQSISPVICDVELINMGNEPFNGTLTIECRKTKDDYFAHKDFPVSNLVKANVQHFTVRFSTDYAGRYFITVKLEEETLDKIYLYEGLELIAEGNRVQTKDSVFLHSFSEFIAIMAIVVGAIVVVAVAVYRKKR